MPAGDNFIWGAEEAVRNLYHDQKIPDQILAMQLTDEQADIMLTNRFAATKFGWEPRWYNPSLERWLHRITVPTLIVWGKDDKLFPSAYAARWGERIPDSRVEIVPECGHVPAVEKPEITAKEIIRLYRGDTLMQFTFFHLMPYRPLDMAERHKHRAAWVVLPNTLYDPKKGADEYESYIDQLVYAEKLGFDVIAVNEHHQTAYGMMPAPNLIAANLIARTSKAKIAIIGRALPLVNNPVNIAEEFAMLDNLSRGRIITGFVRGIGNEYHSTGINPFWSHERYQEAHDLIVQAWTKPGPFAFEGEHFNIRYVNLWPRPYQTPHPPIWIPSMGSSETMKWAAAPERKYPFLVTFSSRELVARYLNVYREQAQAVRLRGLARARSAGPRRSMWPTPTSARARKPRRASRRCSTTSSRCRSRCCCRRATCRCRR